MTTHQQNDDPFRPIEGILLVNKAKGPTSFNLVQILRKRFGVKKIGHAGTLDPFATGVMVMLIGRRYTRLSDSFLSCDKEYLAEVFLGKSTDTHDSDGQVTHQSSVIPSLEEIQRTIEQFQGEILQTPPMFSAKKRNGVKLYQLARQGKEVFREPVKVTLITRFIRYDYPYLELQILCSKGTYIRSIAHEIGILLKCGAHLTNLKRLRSGAFNIEDCIQHDDLLNPTKNLQERLINQTKLFENGLYANS